MKKANHGEIRIDYAVNPEITNEELNPLFAAAWENHAFFDFEPVLRRSLGYVCAYHEKRLVGYVNLAWDGARHAFILDTTVHREYRRRGIGKKLVELAADYAGEKNVDWLHVDFEPHLRTFYFDECGFRSTDAGIMRIKN
jgi:ribosomal protein S18 acetylase RimI-like enzyme